MPITCLSRSIETSRPRFSADHRNSHIDRDWPCSSAHTPRTHELAANWDVPDFGKKQHMLEITHMSEQRLCTTAHTNCSKPGLGRLHRAESPTRMPSLTCRPLPFQGGKMRQKKLFRAPRL